MPETGYSFNGIGHAEAQDRINEYRSGVPAFGAGALLMAAPLRRTSSVKVHNAGEEGACVRMRAGGKTKTQTNENLTALAASATHYAGKLGRKSIVAGSVSITNAGAPATIVDDGEGVLVDTGTTTERGTIDYETGVIDWTYGASPTEPVRATYQHTDYTDFESATQTTTKASGGVTPSSGTPFTIQLGYGRVVPFSVAIADAGALTFIDDGKGNLIETSSTPAKRGTVDYATGLVTFTGASAALTGTMTATYKYNPFAAVVSKAGGQKLLDIFSQLPELTNEVWADGVKGETNVGLWAESRSATQTNLIAQWGHFGEEPYRVQEFYAGFPAGGETNDPNVTQSVNHL